MMRVNRIMMILAVLAIGAATAHAQRRVEDPREALDAAVEDLGPLSESLRDHRVDLRQPTGFEFVYSVGEHDDLLMRISGGLHAVFQRSVYADSPFGPAPKIPPGTVFFLTEPSREELMRLGLGPVALSPRPEDRSGFRISARINEEPLDRPAEARQSGPEAPRADGRVLAFPQRVLPPLTARDRSPEALEEPGGRIVSDHEYRSRRLRDLMRSAAEAEVTQGG